MPDTSKEPTAIERAIALADSMSEADILILFAHLFQTRLKVARTAFQALRDTVARYLIQNIGSYLPPRTRTYPIEEEYRAVGMSSFGMKRLLEAYDFTTILDVGSGSGAHARLFQQRGKQVTTIDLGTSVYAAREPASQDETAGAGHPIRKLLVNINHAELDEQFDCVWASHILEHQLDVHQFLLRLKRWAKPEGIIAITVPPLKFEMVGGHVSLWTPGHLLYNMALAGIDCADAEIYHYGYNITAIARNRSFVMPELTYDAGDVTLLRPWLPPVVRERRDGFAIARHPGAMPPSAA